MLTSEQCRAARALLNWTQNDLAERASISSVSIRAFEKGGDMRESNRKLLRLTFETDGVILIDPDHLGPGARLATANAKE